MDEEAEGVAEQYELPVRSARSCARARGQGAQPCPGRRGNADYPAPPRPDRSRRFRRAAGADLFGRLFAHLCQAGRPRRAGDCRGSPRRAGDARRRATIAPVTFEPGDPARVPSSGCSRWFSALAALICPDRRRRLHATSFFAGDGEMPWLTTDDASRSRSPPPAPAAPAATPRAPSCSPRSSRAIWVKFTDAGRAAS